VAELELVDLLYDSVGPLLVVLNLVDVAMGVLPETTFAEVAVLRTLRFGAVIAGVLLVGLALLVNALAHVLEFVQGS